MASSSSSHQRNEEPRPFSGIEHSGKIREVEESPKVYDVFINHRGPDDKETLARELYDSLKKLGVHSFLDSEEKEIGCSFLSTITTAIRSASVHVAIFSPGYAESAWCLEELVLMLETTAMIIPVFYDPVKPSDLRYPESRNGAYAAAFAEHREKNRHGEDELKKWKTALNSVSFTAGFESKKYKYNNFRYSALCESIVSIVKKEVERKSPVHVAEHSVGLDKLVRDFERFYQERKEKEQAKVLGICGIGGIGKSTLAREFFNRKRSEYHGACFLPDVRENFEKGELPSLQCKLLKDLLREDNPKIESKEEGISHLKKSWEKMPKNFRFLIVLDDIDHLDQLEAFPFLNNLGNSLAIVTTREKGLLTRAQISAPYNLGSMSPEYGRKLFSLHAFGKPHPKAGYEKVVEAFIEACGGLPLYLKVLGKHIIGTNVNDCWSALKKYKGILHRDITKCLEISLETLDREEKKVFMDMACFFVDKSKNVAIRVWEGSGWNAHHALKTLIEKGLVEEIKDRWNREPVLTMHDLLRDLGREMADQDQDQIQNPRRLWSPEHLKNLESEGFQNILHSSATANRDLRCFQSIVDSSTGAKITYFLVISDGLFQKSASLLWLELDINQQTWECIPPWIPLKKLQFLKIMNGDLKRLWQRDVQVPPSLKELHISQTILVEVPDLLGMSDQLEKLVVSVEDKIIEGWSFLESLILNPKCLVLGPSKLSVELASDRSGESATFKSLSSTIYSLSNVRLRGILDLNNRGQSAVGCPMRSLEKLEIFDQHLATKVLVSGYHYPNIKSLILRSMEGLIELDLERVASLNSLELTDCKTLKIMSGISGLPNLVTLNINRCPELEELPCLAHLSCLQTVTIRCGKLNCLELAHCKNLKTIEVSLLPKLVLINIHHCPELENLPDFKGLSCLQRIIIDGCGKLKRLDLRFLNNLKSLTGNVDLTELEITKCPELEELPSLTSLEKLTIKLQDISGIQELPALKNMQLLQCSNAVIRNLTHRLQRVPSEYMVAIGSAVDGAKSTLQPHLFSDLIGDDAVIQINVQEGDLENKPILIPDQGLLSAIIVCTVVVVDSATAPDYIQIGFFPSPCQRLSRGEWIVITVITDQERIKRYLGDFKLLHLKSLLNRSTMEKVCMVTVKKGEELKTLPLVKMIMDRLLKN